MKILLSKLLCIPTLGKLRLLTLQTLALFLAQRGLSDDDGCLDDGRLNDLE